MDVITYPCLNLSQLIALLCRISHYLYHCLAIVNSIGTHFNEILIEIQIFPFTKMHFIISSAKWLPFCPVGDELKHVSKWSSRCRWPFMALSKLIRKKQYLITSSRVRNIYLSLWIYMVLCHLSQIPWKLSTYLFTVISLTVVSYHDLRLDKPYLVKKWRPSLFVFATDL